MATPFDTLKLILKPIQNSGFSLGDVIRAYLENRAIESPYESHELQKIFGSALNDCVMLPLYSTLSYRIQEKFDGPGKHVSTYNIDLHAEDMRKVIKRSLISCSPTLFTHLS
jgi:hypothetical protein